MLTVVAVDAMTLRRGLGMRLYLSSFRNGSKPEELLKLLPGSRAALICNACDYLSSIERAESVTEEEERLRAIGLEPMQVDLRDYFSSIEGLEQTLSDFDLIWVRGGNVFVLRRSMRQSGADDIIKSLLLEDKVAYGGYSAGPCVLAASLRGLDLVDDPRLVPHGYEKRIPWGGLGLIPYSLAPHYQSPRHPESEAINKVVEYYVHHKIPFIPLHDGEALVINGAAESVVGTPDS